MGKRNRKLPPADYAGDRHDLGGGEIRVVNRGLFNAAGIDEPGRVAWDDLDLEEMQRLKILMPMDEQVWEYPHYCWGVYLDDYTSGVHVYGNLIVRAQRGGVMVHGGQDNIIENNIIVDSSLQQVEYAPIDSVTSGRTKGHPVVGDIVTLGPVTLVARATNADQVTKVGLKMDSSQNR